MFFSFLVAMFAAGMFIAWFVRAGSPQTMFEFKKPAWLFMNVLTAIGVLIAFLNDNVQVREGTSLMTAIPVGALFFTYGRIVRRTVWIWLCYKLEPLDNSDTRCYADPVDLSGRYCQPRVMRKTQHELALKYLSE
jgi:NhaP-type Na+/H+ or K+/H+ antiporter